MDKSHNIANLREAGSLQPTPVNSTLAFRTDGYTSLLDALEYAYSQSALRR